MKKESKSESPLIGERSADQLKDIDVTQSLKDRLNDFIESQQDLPQDIKKALRNRWELVIGGTIHEDSLEEINPYDLNSIKKFSIMKETCNYPKCGCGRLPDCMRKELQDDWLPCRTGCRKLTTDTTPKELENINSIQFRSLAIFHIQELEWKITELEKKIEAYRSYCEMNGLQGL